MVYSRWAYGLGFKHVSSNQLQVIYFGKNNDFILFVKNRACSP